MKLLKKAVACTVALSFAAIAPAAFADEAPADATATYVIATDMGFAPFEFQDENADIVGIDMDIIRAIAEDQGFEIEIQYIGWDAAIAACQAGQADAMIAGASITDERKESGWIFSDGYYDATQGMAVAANSEIASFEDLSGKTVAVKNGTMSDEYATSLSEEYGFTISRFDTSPDMYQAVIGGQAAACFDDTPILKYNIKSNELPLKFVEGSENEPAEYGMAAFDESKQELIDMFNAGLANIKENGTYDEIIAKYLGSDEEEAPAEEAAAVKDKYVIATDMGFAPFEFQDENADIVGIDMDIIRAIAEDQGFEIEIQYIGWDAAIAACQAGQADAMIAGASITDARKESGWIFSDGYYDATQGMAVSANSDIDSFDDLSGKTVAVKNGTMSDEYATSLSEEYGFTISRFDTSPDMYQAVIGGQAAACFDDTPILKYNIKTNELPLKFVEGSENEPAEYGMAAFNESEQGLIDMFNAGLANIKEDGTYDEIIATYLGE